MKKWIDIPQAQGKYAKQAHCDLPKGSYERELGKEGFFGPSTHMYHKNYPMGWTAWEGPLKPRLFNLNELSSDTSCPFGAKHVLKNAHMQLRMWTCTSSMSHLVRNADGDELLFIHEGEGDLYCDYGHLSLEAGDYVMLPRGTMWRIGMKKAMKVLMLEATNDSFKLPEKGILGDHAIFDPGVLAVPQLDDIFKEYQKRNDETDVLIKRRDVISTVTFPHTPLDAIGWKGNLHPIKVNVRDIRPVMSHRYHLPPSVHSTFVCERFVVCTFVPRPIESDPGALKVPFFHNNDDFDEILFYHSGDFFSRDNIDVGMLTLHPSGFTHGPHPRAYKAGKRHARKQTDEIAVMIDTRDPVDFHDDVKGTEDKNYVNSWKS